MRHNSFQKIYASYIAPNPDMDVLWMDLKSDPYGSVIKFWNGGIGKYELISSGASTIGKHVIYADDVELPVRSIINFKGFDISENQPGDQLIISIDNKEDAGIAQSIVDYHESEFNHSDIEHSNRAALNSVSGVNTGDQDLSGLASKSELSDALLLKVDKEAGKQLSTEDYTSQEKVKLAGISENANNYILPSDVVHDANYVHTDNNFTDSLFITLSNQSGVNTGDQDLSWLVEKKANHSLVPDFEIEKLAGIEENANNYTHPETHPSSILDVVDVVNGAANKFLNERGEMVAVAHESLTGKNSEEAFQHVDERINEIPAKIGAASYTLLNRRQNLITGTLPNGVNSTLVIPSLISGERNEVILHFKTNATAAPTLVYSGFTPVWLNGNAISMKVNKQYTIVFEQINGIVKTSWGGY